MFEVLWLCLLWSNDDDETTAGRNRRGTDRRRDALKETLTRNRLLVSGTVVWVEVKYSYEFRLTAKLAHLFLSQTLTVEQSVRKGKETRWMVYT